MTSSLVNHGAMLPNAPGSDEKIPLFVRTQSAEELATLSQTTHQPGSDAIVEEAKAAGDMFYRQQKWQEARDAYSQGVHLHASDLHLRKLLLLNLAATNLQLGNWEDVLRNTATVLLADPKSAKALYRAARALNELKRSEEAYDCCTRALKLEPHNEPLQKEQQVAMIGAIKIHYLLLFKAYVDRRLNIIPTWKESPFGAIPTTHPHELPYFDPPIPSDPFNAPILCLVKFRYIERYASNTVTNYPSDKPLLPLLDTFLPGKTTLPPSRTRNNLTYILNESGARFIEHPTTWDPEHEFLPPVLRVYVRTSRGDIIPIDGRSVSTLDDVFERVRQIDADRSDDQRTYLDLVRATVDLFTFRKESEVERKWLNGEFKNPEDLGDPEYIVSERVNNLTDERARDFCYGDPESRGINYPGTFSWTAREGILDLLSSRMGDDEGSSESGSSSH